MFLKKPFIIIAVIMIICISPLWAGDAAIFVDLGFSPDGTFFMFAQYGVQAQNLRPWADLFIVDVARNNFVSGGRLSFVHDTPVRAGQDGSGALYRIIADNADLARRHQLNFLNQGQPLHIDLSGSSSGDNVEFRDFESGSTYRASLVSHVEGSGDNLRSSFFINLERNARDGTRRTYTVGSPQIRRQNIASYHIRRVIIAPHDSAMIFVIEMKQQSGANTDTRYMVEALRL